MDLKISIHGHVQIKDKKHKTILEKDNTILLWGKYKILSSLFQTKNEHVDGIKYLELFDTPMDVKSDINSYNNMNLIKRIQINRKDNIEVLQYDFVAEQWISYGSILNQYYANKSDYRKMYLLEYFQGSPVTPHQFVDLFNLKSQCVNNKLMIRFSIPIYRELTESEVKRFNTMVLTFGGNDIQIDSSTNKLLIKESTNEVIDPKITHRKDNIGLWTSGYPFSIVELPEDVEIRDQLFIYWDFVFTFN